MTTDSRTYTIMVCHECHEVMRNSKTLGRIEFNNGYEMEADAIKQGWARIGKRWLCQNCQTSTTGNLP